MSENIFIVDPSTQKSRKVEKVSLGSIGVKETKDLERWIRDYPELLGERLLVVSSQFSKFDKSKARLDVLAMDVLGRSLSSN